MRAPQFAPVQSHKGNKAMATNLDTEKLLVNIMEAANLLSVGRSTIYKLMNSGDLKVVKLGCSARITMDSIRALVDGGNSAASAK